VQGNGSVLKEVDDTLFFVLLIDSITQREALGRLYPTTNGPIKVFLIGTPMSQHLDIVSLARMGSDDSEADRFTI
jgi:hypothetical protein